VEVEESAGVGGNSGPESFERESDMMVDVLGKERG